MKQVLKRVFKFLLKTIGLIIISLLLYLLVTFILSRIPVSAEEGTPNEIAIYIKTNGVHTDIVVPTVTDEMDWSTIIKYENTVSKRLPFSYCAIGWGDKGFYLETPTWAELKASTALRAAFGLSTSALHATYYPQMIEDESCKKIMISKEQYGKLINYIIGSMDKDSNGNVIHIVTDSNHGETDAFYEASGTYHLFNTCNSWANKGLKVAGQRACLWTAFEGPIFLKYED